MAISDDIENALGDSLAGLAYISTVNGFLNFTATPGWLTERVTAVVGDERLNVGFEEPRTIVIDYSSPNVAKRMHVGHLRSTVIGDALARMLAHKG
ncbi:MAG TPA: arginine--tRNA ligase, partial [Candidatus Poseidoniales archaeon]|nr:arginine--tRNA ligase [Candidatus Poseidoniales archaeon]